MLKKRVVSTLLWDGSSCVKGRQFANRRRVGSLMQAIRVCERRNIDELVVLDIAATPEGRPPFFDRLKDFTSGCFMPVAIGGGVKTLEDIRMLLKSGADKVVIGSGLFDRVLIREASERFGAQAIVGALDVRDGRVITECGNKINNIHPVEMAQQVAEDGAGELILTNIAQDGGESGFDCDLIHAVTDAVSIPVIASGGAGCYAHLLDAFASGADAVAVGSGFLFTDMTPQGARQHLHDNGIPTRLS